MNRTPSVTNASIKPTKSKSPNRGTSSRRDAESARHDLRAAEQQASDDRAQKQQEQSQAAATIDELKLKGWRTSSPPLPVGFPICMRLSAFAPAQLRTFYRVQARLRGLLALPPWISMRRVEDCRGLQQALRDAMHLIPSSRTAAATAYTWATRTLPCPSTCSRRTALTEL